MRKFIFRSILIYAAVTLALSIPELIFKNKGESISSGRYSNGSISNSYLLPYSGNNFQYFSPLSYFILNCGYTNSKVYETVIEAYAACEKSCPNTDFKIMECSRKRGGKMLIHRTHQHGLSVDFMVPKIKSGKQSTLLDRVGMWHYLLEFDNQGRSKINKDISIDFETMGKHILALDDAAKMNGLRIRMIILKIELKDDFFSTPSGRLVKQRGIYFAQSLQPFINKVHDDHYHVDFALAR